MTQWGLIDFSVLIRNVIISNAWVYDYLMGQWDYSLLYVIISNAWVYDYLMGQWDNSLLYVIISNAWVDDYLMGQWDNSLLYVIVPILSMTYIDNLVMMWIYISIYSQKEISTVLYIFTFPCSRT